MRLLIAAPEFPPDVRAGPQEALERLYQQARLHHETRLVVGWHHSRDGIPAEAVPIDLHSGSRLTTLARFGRAVRREVKSWRPDVVLTTTTRLPPLGVPSALISQSPHGGQSIRPSAWVEQQVGTLRARGFDLVVTPTAARARQLRQRGVSEGRIRVVPNGIDVDRFCPDEDALADQASPNEDAVRVLHVSRILPGKGQHHAIDAVARLRRSDKHRVRLDVVGTVGDAVYLDQLRVQSYGHPVHFSVNVPETLPFYRAADIVLLPTELPEASGLVAVEAMACGRPVIWFDHPTVRETTAGIGVAVPVGDVAAMRDAVSKLLADPGERRRLGQLGRRYVVGNRSWVRTWSAYETLLQAIARR